MREAGRQSGYLVLADLSGYTSFVAQTELEHAQGILTNLLALLRSRLTPTLQLAEVEGDALFLYALERELTRGETLLELVESTYVVFRDALHSMQRTTRCPCQACQAIPSLDLKFITHFGDYMLQDVSGRTKPFGSPVNLAHRLLKNRITETTGWQAYALFTELALERMGVKPEDVHEEVVAYEHLGEWRVAAFDLRRRYAELTAARKTYLTAGEAHVTLQRRFAASPARLWDLLTDPSKRARWETGSDWSVRERPLGRTGPGTHNHCAISDFNEEVLDWRPFDYYTVRLGRGSIRMLITNELRENGDGTELRWSMVFEGRAPRALRSVASRLFATKLMQMPVRFERLERLVASDPEGDRVPPAPSVP